MYPDRQFRRSPAVARISLPYPPSPTHFPPELTSPGRDSATEIAAVLAGLFIFLFVYVGIILACIAIILAMTIYLGSLPFPLLWVIAAVFAAGLAFLLVKGLFNRAVPDRNMHVEIEAKDQPIFFAFLRRLTDEIGAPMPHRVYVTPEVTAAMMQELSLVNLVVPPRKNLLVGLGLVNVLNLSEFKAVMGHEFGHFSQKTSRMHAYVYVANRVIVNLISGEDWLDRLIRTARRHARYHSDASGFFARAFAAVAGAAVWIVRKLMTGLFYLINFAALSLSRKNEFHADRIAASVAGSDAIVHALYRLSFAEESFSEAVRQLEVASQHKLYTRDLFFHHSTAAMHLRRIRKKPRLGLPPELKGPRDGRDINVFRDDEDDWDVPEMWSTHPTNFDREENVKEIFIPAAIDDRSPWLLFQDAGRLKERVTKRFYRLIFSTPKDADLVPAEEVQGFLDDEHAEISYDPKYHGSYDDRDVHPGSIADLNQLIDAEPWNDERIRRVHERLYLDLGRRVEDLADVTNSIRAVYRRSYGRPRGRDRARLLELEDEQKEFNDWFASFDRRVYLVHAHMAKQLGGGRLEELTHRYKFQLGLQSIHGELVFAHERVGDVIDGFNHYGEEPPDGYFEEAQEILRTGREVLLWCLDEAHQMRTPEMANIKANTRFADLIFEGDVIRELPETFIKSTWINKLAGQMGLMRHRVNRMDFKSWGAVLQMQDRLAADWLARPPVPERLPELIVVEEPAESPPAKDEWLE
jgi:Zn-dependent protease with chaperone function